MDFKQELDTVDPEEWELHNGGTIDAQKRDEPIHTVFVENEFKDWLLENEYLKGDKNSILVNSFHHQGFSLTRKNNRRVRILARTKRIIEGFSFGNNIVAFQYHPEEFANSITIKYILEKYING